MAEMTREKSKERLIHYVEYIQDSYKKRGLVISKCDQDDVDAFSFAVTEMERVEKLEDDLERFKTKCEDLKELNDGVFDLIKDYKDEIARVTNENKELIRIKTELLDETQQLYKAIDMAFKELDALPCETVIDEQILISRNKVLKVFTKYLGDSESAE